MRLSENRKLAWGVLVVCVLLSIVVLGGSGLARERHRAIEVFNDGSDTSVSVRHSMDAYLDASAEAAQLMASEAELHLGASQTTESVRSLAGQIGDGDDLDARYAAYTQLKTDVDSLYNVMYDGVESADFTNFKRAYDDFWGYENMIRNDEYHQLARSYNSAAGGFPGGLVAGIWGLDELNAFGG